MHNVTTPQRGGAQSRRKLPEYSSTLTLAELRERIANPPPEYIPFDLIYSTENELEFIAEMHVKERRVVLETMLRLVDKRWYTGPGMRVDVGSVRRALVLALEVRPI